MCGYWQPNMSWRFDTQCTVHVRCCNRQLLPTQSHSSSGSKYELVKDRFSQFESFSNDIDVMQEALTSHIAIKDWLWSDHLCRCLPYLYWHRLHFCFMPTCLVHCYSYWYCLWSGMMTIHHVTCVLLSCFSVCLEVIGKIIRTVLCCIVYWSCAQS